MLPKKTVAKVEVPAEAAAPAAAAEAPAAEVATTEDNAVATEEAAQ